jgi:hypothetical protein
MIAAMVSLLTNLEYRGHLISVSAIFDAPSPYQLKTPVVQVRRCDSREVLTTILTHHAFVLQNRAIEFGFVLGRVTRSVEWVALRPGSGGVASSDHYFSGRIGCSMDALL